jgi:uncharacterized protein
MSQDAAMERALEKTNRMNLLLDLYEPLLTDKQRIILQHYFHEDYSLGEIAELFQISRQAVFEHIKRAETILQEYEVKLGLLDKQERRSGILDELEQVAANPDSRPEQWMELVHRLKQMD